jgi:hypothetical protein
MFQETTENGRSQPCQPCSHAEETVIGESPNQRSGRVQGSNGTFGMSSSTISSEVEEVWKGRYAINIPIIDIYYFYEKDEETSDNDQDVDTADKNHDSEIRTWS